MAFANFSEFLHMGGHALYVWWAYGFSIVLFLLLGAIPILGEKKSLHEINRQMQREAQQRQNNEDRA